MFKQLVAATATLSLLVSSPAMAAPEGWDAEHQQLLDALTSTGVHVAINPDALCAKVKEPGAVHGVYFYSSEHDQGIMGVCQDFGGQGEEVLWTENDLDTLRHESIHYLQDCLGDGVNGEYAPIFDGPGGVSPMDMGIKDVIEALTPAVALDIQKQYMSQGADLEVVRLELEAFLLAAQLPAEMIAQSITAQCPAK